MRGPCFLGMVGVMSILSMPASAVITDGFESYTDDTSLRSAWIDQTTFPNTGAFVYLNTDPAFAHSGSNSLELRRHNNNGVKDLSSITSGTTPIYVQAWVMLHDPGANLDFQVGSDTLASNTRQAHVGFTGIGSTIKYRNGSVATDTGIAIVADTWYQIRLVMKPDLDTEGAGGTYDLFINGNQVATDALFWQDKYKVSSSVRIAQTQSPDTTSVLMFADDFEAGLVPEPASLMLVGIGLGVLVTARGRRGGAV